MPSFGKSPDSGPATDGHAPVDPATSPDTEPDTELDPDPSPSVDASELEDDTDAEDADPDD
ncbi:MAG: hypothetical protein PGN07_01930 [Aeromicrobium erythreum]